MIRIDQFLPPDKDAPTALMLGERLLLKKGFVLEMRAGQAACFVKEGEQDIACTQAVAVLIARYCNVRRDGITSWLDSVAELKSTDTRLTYNETTRMFGVSRANLKTRSTEGDITRVGKGAGSRIVIDHQFARYLSGAARLQMAAAPTTTKTTTKKTSADKPAARSIKTSELRQIRNFLGAALRGEATQSVLGATDPAAFLSEARAKAIEKMAKLVHDAKAIVDRYIDTEE